jgi:hypothetical protein
VKEPHTIVPTAVYDLEAARAALNLAKTTLNRELRQGRLRVTKRAGKYFVLGTWLLEWLRAGEVRRARKTEGKEVSESRTPTEKKYAAS